VARKKNGQVKGEFPNGSIHVFVMFIHFLFLITIVEKIQQMLSQKSRREDKRDKIYVESKEKMRNSSRILKQRNNKQNKQLALCACNVHSKHFLFLFLSV